MESLPYPIEIEHRGNTFKFVKELGAGAFGKVYLYINEKTNRYMAVKIEEESKTRQFGSSLKKESYFLRNLKERGVTCIPLYYGDSIFGNNQYIKIEYIDYTIDRYLEN